MCLQVIWSKKHSDCIHPQSVSTVSGRVEKYAPPTTLAADIQACHHSTNIWGATAKEFDPLRWKEVRKEQEAGFLALGSKPFECPAKPTFGPRFVGLLMGILLQEFFRRLQTHVGIRGNGVWTWNAPQWQVRMGRCYLLVPNDWPQLWVNQCRTSRMLFIVGWRPID